VLLFTVVGQQPQHEHAQQHKREHGNPIAIEKECDATEQPAQGDDEDEHRGKNGKAFGAGE
jgi:hypothetical protein